MIQVARLAPTLLGEAGDLVRGYLLGQLDRAGAGVDRDGRADLYYTIFLLGGLQSLRVELPDETMNGVEGWLRDFGDGEGLDFVHLGALGRCWAALRLEGISEGRRVELIKRIEAYRSGDGGYDGEIGASEGNAYGCFLALGAYQDLEIPHPDPLRMVQCLKFLETPDGAWANARGLLIGSTNATAAAVTLLHQLGLPVADKVGDWILAQAHVQGGFRAMPSAPLPDLLSTATALHALACLDRPLPERMREGCLDFIDTLWTAEGGFHGHWADDALDAEYTFYGLLALGHLSV